MDIPTIEVKKEDAEREYKEYSELVKQREEEHLEILKKCNWHLKEGRKLLNIFDVIKQGGVDILNKEPKLGIGRADWTNLIFSKYRFKTGIFADEKCSGTWSKKEFIQLPPNYFDEEWAQRDKEHSWFDPIRQYIKTSIPIIPAILTPNAELSNYYILFEIFSWDEMIDRRRVGNDPILLKRLSENMFVILASWEVSPLEQAVLEGLRKN
jgi:hypothetical protein